MVFIYGLREVLLEMGPAKRYGVIASGPVGTTIGSGIRSLPSEMLPSLMPTDCRRLKAFTRLRVRINM